MNWWVLDYLMCVPNGPHIGVGRRINYIPLRTISILIKLVSYHHVFYTCIPGLSGVSLYESIHSTYTKYDCFCWRIMSYYGILYILYDVLIVINVGCFMRYTWKDGWHQSFSKHENPVNIHWRLSCWNTKFLRHEDLFMNIIGIHSTMYVQSTRCM